MKTLALLGLSLLATVGTCFAEDVAILDVKIGNEKKLQRVVIEFYEADAPNTVANFKKLVSDRFYDGIAFHRIFPNQLVQAGDPLSKGKDRRNVGTGGPGYTLPAEINKRKHVPGAVATARLGDKVNPARVSNGSQFYVALVPMPHLDGQYTVFAHVTEGLDVLEQVSLKPADTNDNPIDRVIIESAQIVPKESAATAKAKDSNFLKFFRL